MNRRHLLVRLSMTGRSEHHDGSGKAAARIAAEELLGERNDVVRDSVPLMVRELVEAEVCALSGPELGERAEGGRATHRNGNRHRAWHARRGARCGNSQVQAGGDCRAFSSVHVCGVSDRRAPGERSLGPLASGPGLHRERAWTPPRAQAQDPSTSARGVKLSRDGDCAALLDDLFSRYEGPVAVYLPRADGQPYRPNRF